MAYTLEICRRTAVPYQARDERAELSLKSSNLKLPREELVSLSKDVEWLVKDYSSYQRQFLAIRVGYETGAANSSELQVQPPPYQRARPWSDEEDHLLLLALTQRLPILRPRHLSTSNVSSVRSKAD